MNKILLIISLLTINLHAKTASNSAVAVMQTIPHKGTGTHLETVILKNNQLIVNGETLSNTEVLLKTPTLKKIMTISKHTTSENCSAGIYKHIVKIENEKEQVETGCIGDDRYRFLKVHFKNIKKDVLIN